MILSPEGKTNFPHKVGHNRGIIAFIRADFGARKFACAFSLILLIQAEGEKLQNLYYKKTTKY